MELIFESWRQYRDSEPKEISELIGKRRKKWAAIAAGAPDELGAQELDMPELDMPETIQTFGDLKKILKSIIRIYQAVELGKLAKDSAASLVQNLISTITGGASGYVKNIATNMVKAKDLGKLAMASKLPDGATVASPFMSMFNIDDDYSKILDDKVENAFINHLAKSLRNVPDDTKMTDFNINKMLRAYLKNNFSIDCGDTDGETSSAQTIKKDIVKTQAISQAKELGKDFVKSSLFEDDA